ncbi:hypothetical protein BJX62DRAFT_242218 [Aspergillus germanicus]
MASSQPGIRPLTILGLPNELLLNILYHFEDPIIEGGPVHWEGLRWTPIDLRREYRETVENVRLVCRVFNDLASPMLCPVLRIDINQRSLDRVVNLSKYSPAVASGVRGICVGLHCFPVELASSLARFTEFRLGQLRDVKNACERHLMDTELGFPGIDEQDEKEAANGGSSQPNDDEYQQILRDGYEAICQKHREQRKMLESQSFVRKLASCVARMPNARALGFYDEDDIFREFYRDANLFLDKTLLVRLMTTPLSWREIEGTRDVHHATACILSELPIAIHEAGTVLHELNVCLFPCIRDHTLVCPEPDSLVSWRKLRAACQSLRRASFADGLNDLPNRHSHIGGESSHHINEYLAALVGSQEMETATIYGRAFGLNDGRGLRGEFDLSPALAGVKWPRIREMTISYLGVTQDAVEAFFTGLGSGCVETFNMGRFELLEEDGQQAQPKGGSSWARALDILRAKLVPQAEEVNYFGCYGGEFGGRPIPDDYWGWDYERPETPSIVKEVEMYISSADMENPVRDIRA